MNRIFYSSEGVIEQQYTNIKIAPTVGNYFDVEDKININHYRVDVATKTLVYVGEPPVVERTRNYQELRRAEYGPVADQLGMLWDDINAGVFGEQAKTSTWFQAIAAIKQANPRA